MPVRILILQFYHDIRLAYKLSEHIPQCAITIWDCSDESENPIITAAAALLIAQKWSDLLVFSLKDLSILFNVAIEELKKAELTLFKSFLLLQEPRPDRFSSHRLNLIDAVHRQRVSSFFHMSMFGARTLVFTAEFVTHFSVSQMR